LEEWGQADHSPATAAPVFNKQGNREPGWSRQSVRSHLSPTLICHLSVERARVFSAPSAWLPQNPQPRKPTSAVCPSKGPAGHRVDSLPPACPPRGAQAPSATPVSGDPAGVGIPGAERQPVAAIRPAYPSFILGQMKVLVTEADGQPPAHPWWTPPGWPWPGTAWPEGAPGPLAGLSGSLVDAHGC
jgi:hypothetical protein